MRILVLPSLAALWLLTGLIPRFDAPELGQDAKLDYARDVLPILKQNCFRCHGDRRLKSGLRLNTREGALNGGYSEIPALIPGQGASSELVRRLTLDDDERMPPLDFDGLSTAQIEVLTRWIDQGANYSAAEHDPAAEVKPEAHHWAYVAPVRPELPIAAEGNQANPIDLFVTKKLNDEGLLAAPRADRETLARRVSLDLTGMPLNAQQLERYGADREPGAYERLVDRLLASDHYGERWARHWLDLARYSDSDGGGMDIRRSMWPYRDWVIHALNRDMPFDQFTTEQMAGDLLPAATRDQQVATGFFRNTITQQEGGADDEEYRIEAVKDRVQITGEVWMGSTMMCAQCHDHKFDPISQRDFYQMFAIFNQTQDGGRTTNPLLELPSEAEARALSRIDAKLAEIESAIEEKSATITEGRQLWEDNYLEQIDAWSALDADQLSASPGIELSKEPDGSIFVGGFSPPRARYFLDADAALEQISALNVQVLKDDRFPNGGPGRGYKGQFVLTGVKLAYTSRTQSTPRELSFRSASADYSGQYYPVSAALDDNINTGWGFTGKTKTTHEAIFVLSEPLDLSAEEDVRLRVTIEHGAGKQLTLGRFKIFLTGSAKLPTPRAYDVDLEAALRLAPEQRSEEQSRALQRQFLLAAPELEPLRDESARLIAKRPVPDSTLVMQAVEEPRDSYVHLRGNFLSKGSSVSGDTPEFLPKFEREKQNLDRLDLARWLTHRGNPLTARVVVNRWWQRLFGLGLVDTESDFGTRGGQPSHPELLDWLAVELMESGWRMKSMLRSMVTSDTYCRSSIPGPDASEQDPLNRLLSHQSRLRLEGEAIRDSALVASGALNPSIGGASVYPPQPEFLSVRTQTETWELSQGADRFRRGLYTWHWRTSPYPFLTLFDGPDGTTSCTRRGQANNALHALAMANDPMIFEIAQELARRVMGAELESVEDGIQRAFLWSLGRAPSASEEDTLADFYHAQLASFAREPEAAAAAAPEGLAQGSNPAEAAAWSAVGRVLFNLHEFITRS